MLIARRVRHTAVRLTRGGRRHCATESCASQRSLHNAPIFRLLLKVAVKGTHQCDFLNFCGAIWPQQSIRHPPRSQSESTSVPLGPRCGLTSGIRPLHLDSTSAPLRPHFGPTYAPLRPHFGSKRALTRAFVLAASGGPRAQQANGKLTWLVLGGDPAARSHRVEQFTAL